MVMNLGSVAKSDFIAHDWLLLANVMVNALQQGVKCMRSNPWFIFDTLGRNRLKTKNHWAKAAAKQQERSFYREICESHS